MMDLRLHSVVTTRLKQDDMANRIISKGLLKVG